MKTIAIPTDFTVNSLSAVYTVLTHNNCEEKLKIVLVHVLSLPIYDIAELLFFTIRNGQYRMIGKDFSNACEIIENRFRSRLDSLSIKFVLGDTKSYVKNVFEAEGVNEIVISSDIELQKPSRRSIDMIPVLEKTGTPIYYINTQKEYKLNTISSYAFSKS